MESFYLLLVVWITKGVFSQQVQISPYPKVTVKQGSDLDLSCSYVKDGTCPPNLNIQWFLNSSELFSLLWLYSACSQASHIPSDVDYTCGVSGNSCIFEMTRINMDITKNGDKWKCIVANTDSRETEVVIEVPITNVTMVTPTESQVNISEGVTSEFQCDTSQGKPASTVLWFKRRGEESPVPITDNIVTNPINSDITAVTRSTLKFVPSRLDHGYHIYCTAYNNGAQNRFTSLNKPKLYIYFPCKAPLIPSTNNGSEYRIIDGKLQTLTCTAEGGRPLASLTWDCFNDGNVQVTTSATTVSRSVTWTARKSQEGRRCTCQPSYSIPEWNSQAYVQIKVLYPPSPPVFTVNGHSVSGMVSVIENRTVNINCSSVSVPAATYTWRHEGTSTTNSVLTLSNVQIVKDGTQYNCTARNTMNSAQDTEEGSKSTQFSLNVLYPPRHPRLLFNSVKSKLITPQQPLYVVKGDSFSILCDFTSSNPEPSSYQWTDQTGNNNVLTVTQIQTDRNFKCTATNNMIPSGGSNENGIGSVTVSAIAWYGPSPPKMTYYLSSSNSKQLQSELHVVKGTSISVSCGRSDSKPAASYSWSSAVVSSSTERLTISNIEKRYNNTDLKCTAKNVMDRTFGDTTRGESHSFLKLIVLYEPTVRPLSNKTIVENQNFTNTCQSEPGNPAETQYTWTRPDGSTQNQQTLSIQRVTRTNMGMYTCEARNIMNSTGGSITNGTDSSTFWLNVLYGSSISHFTINGQSDTQSTFDHSSTLSISCLVDSNPGSTITIKINNRDLPSVSDGVEANYTMTDVRCTDAGVYSCTAFNEYNGERRPTTQHNVTIRSPPVTVEPENNKTFYVAVHNSITISLTVCAYPRPSSILWYKLDNNTGSTNITTGNKTSTYPHYNLTIKDIAMADLGAYQVVLDNGLTPMLKHQFYIVAQGPPEVPSHVNLESATLTHDSLLIKWNRGFNGGLDQTFYIQYRPISDTTWTTLEVTDTGEDTMNITLTGLNPGTVYEVRIYAGNGQGNSSTSETLQFTTHDAPSNSGNIGVILGAASGSVAALIIIVVIVFLQRRYHCIGGKQEKDDKTKMRTNMAYEHNEEEDEEDGDVLVENAAYVSAGPYIREDALQSTEYATVNKQKVVTGGDIYAQVNKKKPEAIYAMPDKKKGGKKDEKDAKEKKKGKGKAEKKKKGGKSKGTQDDTYENAEIGAVGQRPNDENLYELTDTSAKSSRKVNEDGLIYIDVVIDNNNKKKGGQHSNEIHGKDDMTEYTMIDFCKRADPLPDSDTEEK